jgi:MHS family proline/betaine transporter-like MFS transporter
MINNENKKRILACAIGNFVEVYDYSHYMYFSPIIASVFFPTTTHSLALIYIFTIFAIERLIKPIGGIVIGCIADKKGRSKVLYYSVIGMTIACCFICIIPTYHSIGVFAPLLLLIARTIQGFSLSCEFVTSIVYLTEQAPKSQKSIYGSIAFFSGILGVILSAVMTLLLMHFLSKTQITHWGWKIPYLIGIFIILIGYNYRKTLSESSEFINSNIKIKNPIKIAFTKRYKEIIICFTLTCLSATTFTFFITYMSSHLYLTKKLHLISSISLSTINLVFYSLFLIIMGFISDKISAKKIILVSSIIILITIYPALYILNTKTIVFGESVLLVYMILLAGLNGPLPAFISQLFPTEIRVTSLAIGYGTSLSIFGGITPLLCISLTHLSSNVNFLGIYFIVIALIAIFCLFIKNNNKSNYANLSLATQT